MKGLVYKEPLCSKECRDTDMGVQPQMLVADLPEAMLESVREKQKLSVYLPHLNFNSSVSENGHTSQGTSLLASLQVSAHKRNQTSVASTFLSDFWFKVALVACIVVMVLTVVLRLIQWKRQYNKVHYRILPTTDRTSRRSFTNKSRQTLNTETTFAGVSVPLLQDVSDI